MFDLMLIALMALALATGCDLVARWMGWPIYIYPNNPHRPVVRLLLCPVVLVHVLIDHPRNGPLYALHWAIRSLRPVRYVDRYGRTSAALLLLIVAPTLAHAQSASDTASGWLPYLVILGPLLGAILLPLVGWGLAKVTGLEAKLHAWLVAHQESKAADLVDGAWASIDRWVETSAGVLAGQMANGDLSWTDRAAWKAKAEQEIALLQQRAPFAIAQAATSVPDVLAQLMASVDAKMVQAPTAGATPIAATLGTTSTAADTISDAVATIAGARTALAALDSQSDPSIPAAPPAPAPPAADSAPASTVVVNVAAAAPAPTAAPDPSVSSGGVILPGFAAQPMQAGA